MQSVTGEEPLSPDKATLLGPVKVIPQEYPNVSCRSIDVVLPPSGSWQQEKLVEQLLIELEVPISEQIIAYRGSSRWLQTFEAVRLGESLEETPRLREEGVYLITGGLGGIGLVLAEYLAKTVKAKLILTGRSSFPARDEWSNWLATHDETDPVSYKLQKILNLEKLGAEVSVIQADVADFSQMSKALAQIQQQFGQLNGVIHAAGVPGGGLIQRKTRQEVERILAPKIKGTLVLNSLIQNIELDFLVLTSSTAAILGELGQVDYTGANAFLDAIAQHKFYRQKPFTLSINWEAWQKVGMATNTVRPQEIQEHFKDRLQQGILPEEGVKALTRLLGTELSQAVVSSIDFLKLSERYQEQQNTDNKLISQLEKINVSQPKHPRPQLSNDYVAPKNEVEKKIADLWQQLLGVETVGIYDNFFDLGGDSLVGIRLISRLKQEWEVEIAINHLFQSPYVSELALVVEETIISELEELTEDAAQKLIPTISNHN